MFPPFLTFSPFLFPTAGTLDTFKFQEAERMAQMKKREKILSESSDFISVLEEVDVSASLFICTFESTGF